MLELSKSIISIMLGCLLASALGMVIVPLFKKIGLCQSVSHNINERHLAKDGTPTLGGVIFVLPSLFIVSALIINKKINCNLNFGIIIVTFIAYGILGFIDDFLKIKYRNNKGLSIKVKFFLEFLIALLFFFLFILTGSSTHIVFFSWSINLDYLYGVFVLFLLEGTTNAVNITDGLDGLCAGICTIAFFTYGIMAWNLPTIVGNEEVAVFCFIMVGCLLGFLLFNFYPAKIFMGDLGSLALGGALAAIAIVLKKEVSLALIGLVFVIETLSSMLQIISIRVFNRKIFYKSPLHHHFEEIGLNESEIIKIFYAVAIICSLMALIYYT